MLAVRSGLRKEFYTPTHRGDDGDCRSVRVQLGAKDHTDATIAMPYAVRFTHASEPAPHRSRALAPLIIAWTLCLG
jgi:hypothetical protein